MLRSIRRAALATLAVTLPLAGYADEVLRHFGRPLSWSAQGARQFLPGSTHLLTAGKEGRVAIVDPVAGTQVRALPALGTEPVFSADGTRVAVGVEEKGPNATSYQVRVHATSDGRELARHREHPARIKAKALSRDGALAASLDFDGRVHGWEVSSGKLLWKLEAGLFDETHGNLDDPVFLPGGDLILSRNFPSAQDSLYVLEGRTGKVRRTLGPFPSGDSIEEVVASPDGKTLAVYTKFSPLSYQKDPERCQVTTLDIESGSFLETRSLLPYEGYNPPPVVLTYLPDGSLVAQWSRLSQVALRDGRTQEVRRTVDLAGTRVTGVVGSPDGRWLVTHDGRVVDLQADGDPFRDRVPLSQVTGLAVLPGGRRVVTAEANGDLRLWDASTGELLHRNPDDPDDDVERGFAFSAELHQEPAANVLVVEASNKGHLILAMEDLQRKAYVPWEPRNDTSLTYLPRRHRVLTYRDPRWLTFRPLAPKDDLVEFYQDGGSSRGYLAEVRALPDERHLLLWNPQAWGKARPRLVSLSKPRKVLRPKDGFELPHFGLLLHPTGKAALVKRGRSLTRLDLGTGAVLGTYDLDGEVPGARAISPDGALLVVATSGGRLHALPWAASRPAHTLDALPGAEISRLAFSPDGSGLAAASSEGHLATLDVGALRRAAGLPARPGPPVKAAPFRPGALWSEEPGVELRLFRGDEGLKLRQELVETARWGLAAYQRLVLLEGRGRRALLLHALREGRNLQGLLRGVTAPSNPAVKSTLGGEFFHLLIALLTGAPPPPPGDAGHPRDRETVALDDDGLPVLRGQAKGRPEVEVSLVPEPETREAVLVLLEKHLPADEELLGALGAARDGVPAGLRSRVDRLLERLGWEEGGGEAPPLLARSRGPRVLAPPPRAGSPGFREDHPYERRRELTWRDAVPFPRREALRRPRGRLTRPPPVPQEAPLPPGVLRRLGTTRGIVEGGATRVWISGDGARLGVLQGGDRGEVTIELLDVPSLRASDARPPPSGRVGALAAQDSFHLYDQGSGRVLHRLPAGELLDVACDRSGRVVLASGRRKTRGLYRLDPTAQAPPRLLPWSRERSLEVLTVSPDGTLVAIRDAGRVEVLDLETGARRLGPLQSRGDALFSPDGQTFSLHSRTLKVWSLATGKELWSRSSRLGGTSPAAWTEDSRRLLVVHEGQTPVLHDGRTGRDLLRIDSTITDVDAAAIGPRGERLALVTDGGVVRLFDLTSGTEVSRMDRLLAKPQALAFLPGDGELAVHSRDDALSIWNLHHAELVARLSGPRENQSVITLSPDGHVASTRMGHLWDLVRGHYLGRVEEAGKGYGQKEFALSAGGDHLAVAEDSEKGRSVVYRTSDGRALLRGPVRDDRVRDVALSRDGQRLVEAVDDRGFFTQLVAGTGSAPAPTLHGETLVWGFHLDPAGRRAAVVPTFKREFRVYDLIRGELAWKRGVAGKGRNARAFSSDGARLAVAFDDSRVSLVESATGKPMETLDFGADAEITCLAISHAGDLLAVGLASREVLVLRLEES